MCEHLSLDFFFPLKNHNPLIRLQCILWLLPVRSPYYILYHNIVFWAIYIARKTTLSTDYNKPTLITSSLTHSFFKNENKPLEFVYYAAYTSPLQWGSSLLYVFSLPPTLIARDRLYFLFHTNSNRPIYHYLLIGREPVLYLR